MSQVILLVCRSCPLERFLHRTSFEATTRRLGLGIPFTPSSRRLADTEEQRKDEYRDDLLIIDVWIQQPASNVISISEAVLMFRSQTGSDRLCSYRASFLDSAKNLG